MAFGKSGSVRDLWHYIYKEVAKNPYITFEELYNDPKTKGQMKQMFHMYGEERSKERFYDFFSDIKKSHGYEEDEYECDEEEIKGERLEEAVRRVEREFNQVNSLVENICRKNASLSRYHRTNSADKLSYSFNESCHSEDEEDFGYNADIVENDVSVMLAALESVFGVPNYVIDWDVRGKYASSVSFTVSDEDRIIHDNEVEELIAEVDDMITGEISYNLYSTDLEVEITY